MRVLISGGGTGGHVYPALAVATQIKDALQRQAEKAPTAVEHQRAVSAHTDIGAALAPPPLTPTMDSQCTSAVDLLWVGSSTGVERHLVAQAGLPYRTVQTGQVRGKNPLTALTNLGKMVVGIGQALAIAGEFQPDVCLVTGGYVCIPVAIACRLRNVPLVIYLPDMTPGMAIRWLSILATRIAVSFPEVAPFFGEKALVTGYPVRPELLSAVADRQTARQTLGRRLHIDWQETVEGRPLPLLLVFGGSSGARSINLAVWQALPQLLPAGQILHVVGERDWSMLDDYRPDLPEPLAQRYHPVSYLHEEMNLALASADLVLARAGASTLGEFPIAHLPAILVPLAGAGGHQMPNARQLADRGGAVIVEDANLAQELAPITVDLLGDEHKRRHMGANAASLARPRAASAIAQELVHLAMRDRST